MFNTSFKASAANDKKFIYHIYQDKVNGEKKELFTLAIK